MRAGHPTGSDPTGLGALRVYQPWEDQPTWGDCLAVTVVRQMETDLRKSGWSPSISTWVIRLCAYNAERHRWAEGGDTGMLTVPSLQGRHCRSLPSSVMLFM